MIDARQIKSQRIRPVRKSNELIQKARYKLDVLGQKVLLYLISKIEPDDKSFRLQDFLVTDFCHVCGINDSGPNYRDLKEALTSLLTDSAKIWIPIDNNCITPLTWIDPPVINKTTGRVTVKLNDNLRPYLLDLKKNYTQYELIYTLRFRSKYSIRLYEIVKSYHYHDETDFTKSFDVDELKTLLDAEHYIYRDFKRRVLTIAISEINSFTDRNIVLSERKSGRLVVKLDFTISAKSGDELEAVRVLNVERTRRKKPDDNIPGQVMLFDP